MYNSSDFIDDKPPCQHDFAYYLENGRTIGKCRTCRQTKTVSEKRAPDMRIRRIQWDAHD